MDQDDDDDDDDYDDDYDDDDDQQGGDCATAVASVSPLSAAECHSIMSPSALVTSDSLDSNCEPRRYTFTRRARRRAATTNVTSSITSTATSSSSSSPSSTSVAAPAIAVPSCTTTTTTTTTTISNSTEPDAYGAYSTTTNGIDLDTSSSSSRAGVGLVFRTASPPPAMLMSLDEDELDQVAGMASRTKGAIFDPHYQEIDALLPERLETLGTDVSYQQVTSATTTPPPPVASAEQHALSHAIDSEVLECESDKSFESSYSSRSTNEMTPVREASPERNILPSQLWTPLTEKVLHFGMFAPHCDATNPN
jgi:hypothetical protein